MRSPNLLPADQEVLAAPSRRGIERGGSWCRARQAAGRGENGAVARARAAAPKAGATVMKQLDDETLLGELGAASVPRRVCHPRTKIDDLRELVMSSDSPRLSFPCVAPREPARMLARGSGRCRGACSAQSGSRQLAGTSMPGSMRDPARAVGFPVESQEMTEARACGRPASRGARAGQRRTRSSPPPTCSGPACERCHRDELHQIEPEADRSAAPSRRPAASVDLDDRSTARTVGHRPRPTRDRRGRVRTHAPPPAPRTRRRRRAQPSPTGTARERRQDRDVGIRHGGRGLIRTL